MKIKVLVTAHYEDKGQDTMVIIFVNDEAEEQMVEAMADLYNLNEDGAGNRLADPLEGFTWEWLESQVSAWAWWYIEERDYDVTLTPANSAVSNV